MKEEVLRLRITADLKEEVKKAAAEKGLTVSAYVTMILTEATRKTRKQEDKNPVEEGQI